LGDERADRVRERRSWPLSGRHYRKVSGSAQHARQGVGLFRAVCRDRRQDL